MNSCQFLLLQVPLLWQCLRGSACRASGRRRPTSCGHRLDARRPADATIFETHITDAQPMPHDDRPMQNRPVGRLSEFPALSRELIEPTDGRPITGRPADARKMKSAGRRGNIGPSAGLVIL